MLCLRITSSSGDRRCTTAGIVDLLSSKDPSASISIALISKSIMDSSQLKILWDRYQRFFELNWSRVNKSEIKAGPPTHLLPNQIYTDDVWCTGLDITSNIWDMSEILWAKKGMITEKQNFGGASGVPIIPNIMNTARWYLLPNEMNAEDQLKDWCDGGKQFCEQKGTKQVKAKFRQGQPSKILAGPPAYLLTNRMTTTRREGYHRWGTHLKFQVQKMGSTSCKSRWIHFMRAENEAEWLRLDQIWWAF